MSFIGMGFYGLLRRGGCPVKPAGVLGILFLLGYTVMIGGGVSAIRAFVMFGIRVGADLCGRAYDMATSLSVAAALIAMESPMYLRDAGYLLSFGAVLGMAAVYPLMMSQGKTESKILQSFQASLAVNLVLFPVMLSFYYEFPPYSLLLNLVIIPLMSVVLGAGLLGSFLCLFFKPAGGVVFLLCRGILNLYEWSCNLSMKLPFSRMLPESRKLAGSCCIMQYCFWSVCTGCFERENRKNLFCVGNAGSGRNLSGSKRSDETPRGVSGDDAGCGTGRWNFSENTQWENLFCRWRQQRYL